MAFQVGRNLIQSLSIGGKNYHLTLRYDPEFSPSYYIQFFEGDWQASNPSLLWTSPPLSDVNWSRNDPKAYLQFYIDQLNSYLATKFSSSTPPAEGGPPVFDNTTKTWLLILEYWIAKMKFQTINNVPVVIL